MIASVSKQHLWARHSPPDTAGWTRHQEEVAKPPLNGADGVVENGTSSKNAF